MLERFFPNLKGSFDGTVVSLKKRIRFSSTFFIDISENFSANI